MNSNSNKVHVACKHQNLTNIIKTQWGRLVASVPQLDSVGEMKYCGSEVK